MTLRILQPRLVSIGVLACLLFGADLGVHQARADRGVSSTLSTPPGDKGAGIVGLKVGVDLPQAFTALGTSFFLEVEGGYLLPFVRRLFAVTVSFAVGMPGTSDEGLPDSRVPGGTYSYSQTTQQFLLGLTAWAKIPLGRLVPYVGVGPRLFIVRTFSSGSAADGTAIPESLEMSKEAGVAVPVGLEFLVGPGRLFGEFQLLYAPSSQRSTGPASFGAMSIAAGYRLVL